MRSACLGAISIDFSALADDAPVVSAWLMRGDMPAAPKLGWCLLGYYVVLFVIGVTMDINRSYETPSLLEVGRAGLWWLMLTNVFFFLAPWAHQSWIAPAIVVLLPAAMVFAGTRLRGWIRLAAIIVLLLCLNAYSIYVVTLTGG